jgi:hypothetical protein
METELMPRRCAWCHTLSEPRPLGSLPDDWIRGRCGWYYCADCTADRDKRRFEDREKS